MMTRSWWKPAVFLAAWMMALRAPELAAQSDLLPGDARVDAIEDATRRVLVTAAGLPDGSEMRMVR